MSAPSEPGTRGSVKAGRSSRARVACTAGLALALCAASAVALPSVARADDATGDAASAAPQDGGQPDAMGEVPDGGGMGGDAPDGGGMGGGGADTQSFDYSGTYSGTVSADGTEESVDGESVDASESLVNAILAQNGGIVSLANADVTKSGNVSDGDSCNFYGVNSIVLAVGEGSLVRVSDSALSATSEGSNGLFATDGATIWANNTTIQTESDNSRGLDATYGGTVIANEMTIDTEGDHCAGAANDRGGGYVSVTNSSIETAGSGSPILYSTGCVEADNVTGTATGSQLVGMEGLNTIRIANSTLESTITRATASDPVANGVIIYQSTSGDADTSTGERALFEVRDSSLSSSIESGSMFYLTNTSADILLVRTDVSFDTDAANLLTVEGNDANNWGTSGSNGADVTLTAREQTLEGNVSVDTISSLALYLLDGSTYTGTTSITENDAASTVDEPLSVTVESGSAWVVTADSTVSNLSVEEGASIVDEDGATVTIVADGETVVSGESDLTVTVEGSYSTEIDTSDALELSEGTIDRADFDDYYETSTTFGTNGDATATAADTSSDGGDSEDESAFETEADDEDEGGFLSWLQGVWDWITSLFS